ncbi:Organic cation transporter protein [Aphelenchoides bicaudatus]|nr:Organic cation transporter protein [Aphelenchoides bicaudatus]
MLVSPERTKKFTNNRAFCAQQNGLGSKSDEALEQLDLEADKNEEVANTSNQFPSKFGAYEFFLLILTQCGYLPVAASLLSTTFFEPPKTFCHSVLNENSTTPIAFNSLLFQLIPAVDLACQRASSLNFQLTTSVMAGGIFGSFLAGFLADRFGRKPVVVGTLLTLAMFNLLLLLAARYGILLALIVFFIKGCACGGYMVTNVVFILEAVKAARTRLLVASLNGWPIGMLFTGLVGWLCEDWTWYGVSVAATALVLALLLYSQSFESAGWLDTRLKTDKAHKIRHRIHQKNQRLQLSRSLRSLDSQINGSSKESNNKSPINGEEKKLMKSEHNQQCVNKTNANDQQNHLPPDSKVYQINSNIPKTKVQPPSIASTDSSSNERRQSVADAIISKSQNYLDLFKHEDIRRPLCALLFSFMTSSVVSFGFYFTTDAMSGSRYVNLALMGALKFTLGLIPYALSFMASKKRILIGSVGSACIACWILALLCTWLGSVENPIATALGVAITASMDPTWKISHLYSVELFPTEIAQYGTWSLQRNCSVGKYGWTSNYFVSILESFGSILAFCNFTYFPVINSLQIYANKQ